MFRKEQGSEKPKSHVVTLESLGAKPGRVGQQLRWYRAGEVIGFFSFSTVVVSVSNRKKKRGESHFRPNKNSTNITVRETFLSAPSPGCGEV